MDPFEPMPGMGPPLFNEAMGGNLAGQAAGSTGFSGVFGMSAAQQMAAQGQDPLQATMQQQMGQRGDTAARMGDLDNEMMRQQATRPQYHLHKNETPEEMLPGPKRKECSDEPV